MLWSRRHQVCSNCTKVRAILLRMRLTHVFYCAGAILIADSTRAELEQSINILGTDAQSVEVRVRSRLPARYTQPTVSVGGGQEQVLEAAAGGGGRLTVKLPAGTAKVVLQKWTEGVEAVVSVISLENGKRGHQSWILVVRNNW